MENLTIKDQVNKETIKIMDNISGQADKRLQDIKVLMYHRLIDSVEAKSNFHWTTVTQKDFIDHLKVLESFNYTPITFNDLRLHLLQEIELPKKPVIITFDDGYKDFYELGYPVLKEFGMRAVIFALGDRSITENIWDDSKVIPRAPLMNDRELQELHSEGFEIGAHSCTHRKLTELDDEKLHEEIFKSKKNLESVLNSKVYSFCYPYGLENEKVQNAVREARFTFGCTVYNGPLRFGDSLYNIHRVTIKNGMGALSFGLRMLTPFEYVEVSGSKIKRRIIEQH
ncbi:MAG TPA: polysaccharide deacetylase family protein [Gracilimonas sp.]|uniref:polysaccharide deacetylase family protein n=1 Tax=Gracilimonas sp. TaxID=1974203 RepID=UPI002DA50956|nr:polysaccharide deacetylase family protein [Gracilimonas sp.]